MNQQDPLYGETNSEATLVNHDNYYERYALILAFKDNPYDNSLFKTIVTRNKHKGSAKCMKIMGLVTYIAHK